MNKKDAKSPSHPGNFVRETCLRPRKISVTKAAKLIGISRPGVSNFLNGKVSTTPDMAARIERVFGISASELLDMQNQFDVAVRKVSGSPSGTRVYVPPFLEIKANEIIGWVDNNHIFARSRLSVLLRTLVHSTGAGLEKVDFPGNDDAERPGWDGFSDASSGTPWVPAGATGWEFGVNKKSKVKADHDFIKSVRAHKKPERDQMTFVFVTPRRWAGKETWVAEMKGKGQWKDVRAYDASDLEQWLEQSPAGQSWFVNETGHPSKGVRSLDKCWSDWVSVAKSTLNGVLFETAISIGCEGLKEFLSRPVSSPFIITADSAEEALAFLAQAFSEPDLLFYRDKILVFDEMYVLPKLVEGTQDFIAVIHTRDVELELAVYAQKLRSIIISPRNSIASTSAPDIILEPLSYEPFRKGLEAMGCGHDEIEKLSNESGRSLTVLRRRLSKVEAVRKPEWADHETASLLVPFMLLGAWNTDNEGDCEVLSLLGGDVPFEDLDKRVQKFVAISDAPVWSIGKYRGIFSKIDALFAIAGAVTQVDINRYLNLAKIVLGEDDPALDLPETKRWMAEVYEKRREFSKALRNSVSETLVLLAVHGKHLFKARLGFDGECAVESLVSELLQPLTARKLEASYMELPVYAEAAPDEFLRIIEEDLRTEEPAVIDILRQTEEDIFSVSYRSGLLQALECLAWNPETLPRVVLILGRLYEVKIGKPILSLQSIFRVWMPQTAANHQQRLSVMKLLIKQFPATGWKICIDQFGKDGREIGNYSYKPRWRSDGYGYGEPFPTEAPADEFRMEMVEMALSRPTYNVEMLCDLIGKLYKLDPDFQDRIWEFVKIWFDGGAKDNEIGKVREKIRVTALSQREGGCLYDDEMESVALAKKAKAIYDWMEPTDLINRHEWLFRQAGVQGFMVDLNDLDFKKREERIEECRTEALRAIYDECGMSGIFDLSELGNAEAEIGSLLIRNIFDQEKTEVFLLEALCPGANETPIKRKKMISRALCSMTENRRSGFLDKASEMISESDMLRLLLLAPFKKTTWLIVDKLSVEASEAYWQSVHPEWIFNPEEDNNEAIERMLKTERPRAAFSAVRFKLEAIRPALLVKILSGIAKGGKDKRDQYQLEMWKIETAFTLLDSNPDVSFEEKARLELVYIDSLASVSGSDRSHIPNLERYIEEHPEIFVQVLAWAYKREKPGDDPEEFRLPEGQRDLAKCGYRLLKSIKRIPGQNKDGKLDKNKLLEWIQWVRETSIEIDRLDVCDRCLGRLLSCGPVGEDGIWPCEVVRDIMQEIRSNSLSEGACTGIYNSRGVQTRGVNDGGDQEREVAAKYRKWAGELQVTHPFVSSSLLKEIVNIYEKNAEYWDTNAGIRRRLLH